MTKPPITVGNATLYLGDCLEILEGIHRGHRRSAVITDPPYGTDADGAGYGRAARHIINDTDCAGIAGVAQLAARRWLGSWLAVFYSPRKTLDFFAAMAPVTFRDQIVWDKKAPGLTGPGVFRYRHENIGLFSVGEPRAPLAPGFSVQVGYRVGGGHPHEKPVGLMREIVRIVPGDVVVDPFMGSGTTGVACANEGREFIGIEIDPQYFDAACRRVDDAHARSELFTPPPKTPEQPDADLLGGAK